MPMKELPGFSPANRKAKPWVLAMVACILISCGGEEVQHTMPPVVAPPSEGQEVKVNSNKQEPMPAVEFPASSAHANAELTYRIIDAPNGTFGYDILSNGRLFVHQTNLPGMPGIEGCRSQADAEKLAAFVIAKIRQGQMPPSITPAELDSLQIR